MIGNILQIAKTNGQLSKQILFPDIILKALLFTAQRFKHAAVADLQFVALLLTCTTSVPKEDPALVDFESELEQNFGFFSKFAENNQNNI